MGKCRGCGKPVRDGEEYCNECLTKKKADESYLDSLLSSVAVPAPAKRERPTVKSTAKPIEPHLPEMVSTDKKESNEELPVFEEISEEDIPDYNIMDDSDDSYLDELFPSDSTITETIPDEITEEKFSETEPAEEEFDEPEPQEMELLNDLLRSVGEEEAEPVIPEPEESEELISEAEPVIPEPDESEESFSEAQPVIPEPDESEEFLSEAQPVIPEPEDEDVFLEEAQPVIPEPEEEEEAGSKVSIIDPEESDGEEDILDFWNSINIDGNEEEKEEEEAAFNSTEEPKAVAPSNEDTSEVEEDYLNMVPDHFGEESESTEEAEEVQQTLTAQPKKKKKRGLLSRIFGNVKEDISEEELENRKKAALEKFEDDEKKAIEKVELDKTKKQEKEEKNKEAQAQKAEQDKEKKEKQKLQAEQKKELKDKREMARKALLEEIEQNEGKINKVGASFVFVVFAAILCFITIGTSIYTYRVAIENATFDFDLKRYQDAYDEVYGLRIKEEDQELYDKIMTVQYVNTQLISYLKYTAIDQDAEALDSLMKGLRRYEKYIYYGTQLGIKDDLNYLKTQILTELDTAYHMTEADAYEMLAIEAQEIYSQAIYDKVSANNITN